MSANTKTVCEALQKYKIKVIQKSWDESQKAAEALLRQAIKTRRRLGHNFTGNLINSIRVVVVAGGEFAKCLKEDKVILRASDLGSVRVPIWGQMSADSSAVIGRRRIAKHQYKFHRLHGDRERQITPGHYIFVGGDYDWKSAEIDMHYQVKVTILGAGRTSIATANMWAQNVKCTSGFSGIEIHVGYITQYAKWVEEKHQTTGYNYTRNVTTLDTFGARFEKA